MAELALEGISKRFGRTQAIAELDLHVGDGELLVLLGPTGAGKTTTLRLAAGLERPDRGRICIGGLDVTAAPPAARDVAFVFQQYSLYPHLSVYDNLAFPLRSPVRRVPEPEIARRVRQMAELLRIEQKLSSRATQLSGGQMQRVAIGRALVRRPAMYLMDEPLSSLDAKLRAELRVELKRIQREVGATILYVTHDQTEAMTMATRIGVLQEGRLVQLGDRPRDLRGPAQRPRRHPPGQPLGQPDAAPAVPRGARPRPDRDHRRAHRARAHPQGPGDRGHPGPGPLDRAPGRPEPPAHPDGGSRRSGHPGRPRHRPGRR
jgi:multiple sugar transport system ATP-binding protein